MPDIGPYDLGLIDRPTIGQFGSHPINNNDGSISTVRSISVDANGKTYLIPTVINGSIVSNQEAIKHFRDTGKHLGTFRTISEADAYARLLHDMHSDLYSNH